MKSIKQSVHGLSGYVLFLAVASSGAAALGQDAEPGAGVAGGPDGSSGYRGAGYEGGGGYGGGAYGGGGPRSQLTSFELLQINEKGEVTKKTRLKAAEQLHFTYRLGTLEPIKVEESSGYAMGYGGPGMGGGGYGGGGPGMGAGDGMDYGGEGSGDSTLKNVREIDIRAFVFSEKKDRRRTILIVSDPARLSSDAYYGGMGGGGGDMYGGGLGDDEGYYGGDDGGGMGDMMGGMGGPAGPPTYVPLDSLVGKNLGTKKKPERLAKAEVAIVSDVIKQLLWKEDALRELRANSQSAETIKEIEPVLKAILSEQYTTQLARQRMEVQLIEAKVKKLKAELARREAAKDRVVEIQTGRMVLEAQGLLREF